MEVDGDEKEHFAKTGYREEGVLSLTYFLPQVFVKNWKRNFSLNGEAKFNFKNTINLRDERLLRNCVKYGYYTNHLPFNDRLLDWTSVSKMFQFLFQFPLKIRFDCRFFFFFSICKDRQRESNLAPFWGGRGQLCTVPGGPHLKRLMVGECCIEIEREEPPWQHSRSVTRSMPPLVPAIWSSPQPASPQLTRTGTGS